MPGTRGARRPICSRGHESPVVKMRHGFVCPTCFDEHVGRTRRAGIILPEGVVVEGRFDHLYPNRAARRAA